MHPIIEFAIKNRINYSTYYLMFNSNMTFEDVLMYCGNDVINKKDRSISLNPNITAEIVINNKNINWDYSQLCRHLSFEDIKMLNKRDIDMYEVSKNPKITWEHIKNNLDWEWEDSILCNPNITMKNIESFEQYNHLQKFMHIKHRFRLIIKNPNIDIKMLIKCLEQPNLFLDSGPTQNICFQQALLLPPCNEDATAN
jgi:hypothetical protein